MRRSGRFDYILYVPPPSFNERKMLFKHFLNISEEYKGHIDWNVVSLSTAGYSGADIERICKTVKMNLIEQGAGLITTKRVQDVLKSEDYGKSSLEDWYVSAWNTYVKPQQYRKEKKDRIPIGTAGKFSKEERQIYKELVRDVTRYHNHIRYIKLIRFLARGI
jgi:SpoVK/Ycf46/Vps4 family AAA+-type ATPase